eukprot:Pgem_evm1s13419
MNSLIKKSKSKGTTLPLNTLDTSSQKHETINNDDDTCKSVESSVDKKNENEECNQKSKPTHLFLLKTMFFRYTTKFDKLVYACGIS